MNVSFRGCFKTIKLTDTKIYSFLVVQKCDKNMACSKEEIELKRLAALQKRQSKLGGDNHPLLNSPGQFNGNQPNLPAPGPSQTGPVKSYSSNNQLNNSLVGNLRTGPVKSSNITQKSFHPYAKPNNIQENSVPVTKVVSGTVYLISEERFEVNPSEFCTPLINIFKTIPSRSYDPKSKLWNFALEDYEVLMSKVAPLAPHVVLGGLPTFVLKILRDNVRDPSNVDLTPIEVTLRHKLMPFQEDGVRFAIARGGRCMLADDMGLGKTFQALAVASYYRHNWPLLIVTTSSMRETWQSKIHELLPSVPLMNIVTLTSSKDAQMVADRQTEVVIVSYKITTMHTDLLKSKNFGFVIIDESHYLKSHKAQCTIALGGITKRVSRCVLLSGTPALSRPAELFTQLALIEPRLMPSFTEYGKRYCDGKQSSFGWDMSGQSNLAELQVVLQRRFLIRRTKEQVLTSLEEKTRESVLLDQTLLQFSKQDEEGLSQVAETYRRTKAAERHSALITYFSETARVKIPAICKYIRTLVSECSDKFLVFAHHRCVIDAICYELDEAGVHYACIVGATPSHTRAELVDKFQHGACRACVLSVTAANSGITLTAAALVLFAELHWNPGVLTQAEARAHRIGQTGAVRVRYLLANGTADDFMWPMLQEKLNVLNNVGLSKDTFADTTMKHQGSKNNITQYLTPPKPIKNKNDYIPGTNIRKQTHIQTNKYSNCNGQHSRSDLNNSGNFSTDTGHSSTSDKTNFSKCVSNDSQIGDISSRTDFNVLNSVNLNSDRKEMDNCDMSEIFEKSFFDEDGDDELLAQLDL